MLRVNGFYGHIKQHDHRSIFMFAGFMVAFQIVAGVVLALPLTFMMDHNILFANPIGYFKVWGPWVFIAGTGLFIFRYFAHMQDLHESMGFDTVDRRTQPRLFTIIEPIAITAGIPMPAVAILESQSLNAFACGLDQSSATVVVTKGLMNALNDDELGAVIAHEITHIKNGDIALMAVANTALASIKWLEKWNFLKFGKKRSIFLIFMPVFIVILMMVNLVMNIGTSIAKVSRLVIASSREYIADAEAVRLTHNPAALISALRKIEGRSAIEGLDEIADAMMIDGAFEGAFATHPTIAERIAVLAKHAGSMAFAATPSADTRVPGSEARFGHRQSPEVTTGTTSIPPKSLFERVNAGSKTNIFGINKTVAKFMRYGIIAMMVLTFGSSMIASNNMKQISNQLSGPSIKTKQTSDLATSSFGKFSSVNNTIKSEVKPVQVDKITTAAEKKNAKPTASTKLSFSEEFRGTSN